MLWKHLYAEWRRSSKLLLIKYPISCVATAFSIILDRNLRFEIGLKFEYSWNSKILFFSLGFNIASLSCAGTHPVSSDLLIMLGNVGSRVSLQLLRIVAGIGLS